VIEYGRKKWTNERMYMVYLSKERTEKKRKRRRRRRRK